MGDLLDEAMILRAADDEAKSRMQRFRKFSPSAADSYEKAEREVAELLSDVQRMLAADPGEAVEYAARIRGRVEHVGYAWATARKLLVRFAMHDFPPVRATLP
jgi:hypothetical protein